MQIVIAPQAFKGTLSALEAAQRIEASVKRLFPKAKTLLVPVADGGDGTLDVLVTYRHGQRKKTKVMGASGTPVYAYWGILPDAPVVVIEMAKVCGLAQVPTAKRRPTDTTTFGVGQIIRRALDAGYRRFIIGVGGSATNDGGAGIAQALGVRFLDKKGRELPLGGAALSRLEHIERSGLDPRICEAEIRVACDVLNPLVGPEGATKIYAKQKGASSTDVQILEKAMKRYALIIKRDLGVAVDKLKSGGAGGGTGAGLVAFCGAQLEVGIEVVLEILQFKKYLRKADLVITGEGCMDRQTLYNKAPLGVAKAAKAQGLPVLAIVGSVGAGYELLMKAGIDEILLMTKQRSRLNAETQRRRGNAEKKQ